ncbi:MAG: cellulase family glycosylhydrolase [Clostridia bacterium]|nr:cellulase family glycosylhydrolase [Clostridia bacterium]
MKKSGKALVAAGIAAGAVAASVPAAINMLSSKANPGPAPRPAKISCDGQGFQTSDGENIKLRILYVRNYTLNIDEREKLVSRFGPYGMAQLAREHEKAMLCDKDLAYIAALGFNCVGISFSYTLIYPNGKIGKKPDFTALDSFIEKCCENGLYVILNLTDAHSFAKREKPGKALVKIWGLIAAHYKDDSAVALYDLTAPGFEGDIQAFSAAAIKAIRKSDFEKDITGPVNSGVKFTYSLNPADKSLIYSEQAVRCDAVKTALDSGGIIAFEAFRAQNNSLFTLDPGDIDISVDSYEELLKKYAAINSAAVENKSLAEGLKDIFINEPVTRFGGDTEEKKKIRFNFELRRGTKLTKISR